MPDRAPLHLFDGYGVELEYMIVDRETLDVKPIADELIKAAVGEYVSDVDRGEIAWSNELVTHVIELKTNGPASDLASLAGKFQKSILDIDNLLRPMNARLMPAAAHPWMDPMRETRLWPHEYDIVYQAYHRIFDCRGHGWSNLQSTHINLPFDGDAEFGRLHAAIRLVLPLLPALAASSPIIDGQATGFADTRLRFYEANQKKIPSIAGHIIPERVYTHDEYERVISLPIYREIAPHDPDEILRDEFLNSRGAIARFGRGAIEIRVLDLQECAAADLAIVRATVGLVKALVEERVMSFEDQKQFDERLLKRAFDIAVREGGRGILGPELKSYFAPLCGRTGSNLTLRNVWLGILENHDILPRWEKTPLAGILDAGQGTLADRILRAAGLDPAGVKEPVEIPKETLRDVYRVLCACASEGVPFLP